ncbi:hypothetical protein ACFLWC_04260 [Chloroflexota bacterium]
MKEPSRYGKLIHPRIGVLILSAYDDDEYVFALLKAGAAGYLLKNVSGDELTRAIRAVHKGEPVLDPIIARKVMNYFTFPGKVWGLERPPEHLSNRETDIIKKNIWAILQLFGIKVLVYPDRIEIKGTIPPQVLYREGEVVI